ncbi:MAG TPA: hypothetical protein VK893_13585 [Pyrinomonadaceae bacterium]|nr:hypothetical protein [Pyrinomonadaceae bacterium]
MRRIFQRIGLLLLVLTVFVCPACAKKTLRVMTYNIHAGVGMDKKLDLQRIANVINSERPELVGLQDVDYPADKPAKRIDHIFYSKGVQAKKARVVETLASDHLPVVADVEFGQIEN